MKYTSKLCLTSTTLSILRSPLLDGDGNPRSGWVAQVSPPAFHDEDVYESSFHLVDAERETSANCQDTVFSMFTMAAVAYMPQKYRPYRQRTSSLTVRRSTAPPATPPSPLHDDERKRYHRRSSRRFPSRPRAHDVRCILVPESGGKFPQQQGARVGQRRFQ
jgi:hypothetical protein